MLGLQRSVLGAFIHVFGDWILARSGNRLFEQPGAVLFPKGVHELDPAEPQCPDGSSVEYVLLALSKAESADGAEERRAANAHPFERILRMARRETRWCLAVERLLLARLDGETP